MKANTDPHPNEMNKLIKSYSGIETRISKIEKNQTQFSNSLTDCLSRLQHMTTKIEELIKLTEMSPVSTNTSVVEPEIHSASISEPSETKPTIAPTAKKILATQKLPTKSVDETKTKLQKTPEDSKVVVSSKSTELKKDESI